MSHHGVSAVILAAGESRRMGTANKLTLDVGGTPLLRRAALIVLEASVGEVVAVVGHAAGTARTLLRDLPIRLVANPRYRAGRSTSLFSGIKALRSPCEGVMVCLADQPLLEPQDLNVLIEDFGAQRDRTLVPTYKGHRGNPVILTRAHREAILRGYGRLAGRDLILSHPELVRFRPMDNDHCLVDLDTPADYRRLTGRIGAQPS